MSSAQNVRVDLVLKNLPDIACFESPLDWFKAIPDYIGGQVSSSVSNVVVSNVQPTDSQTTSVWFRVNNAGSFVGIYVFSGGQWQSIYPNMDQDTVQVQWMFNADGTVPDGWTKIVSGDTVIDPAVVTALTAQYIQDPSLTFDVYFAARFSGF